MLTNDPQNGFELVNVFLVINMPRYSSSVMFIYLFIYFLLHFGFIACGNASN